VLLLRHLHSVFLLPVMTCLLLCELSSVICEECATMCLQFMTLLHIFWSAHFLMTSVKRMELISRHHVSLLFAEFHYL